LRLAAVTSCALQKGHQSAERKKRRTVPFAPLSDSLDFHGRIDQTEQMRASDDLQAIEAELRELDGRFLGHSQSVQSRQEKDSNVIFIFAITATISSLDSWL